MSRTAGQARRDVGRWVKRDKEGDRAHVIVSSPHRHHRHRHHVSNIHHTLESINLTNFIFVGETMEV